MFQQNGKTAHVLWLEELKCPKQSTDLMQSLLNYQWHLHRARTYNPKVYLES